MLKEKLAIKVWRRADCIEKIMDSKRMKITAKKLRLYGACEPQIKIFERLFPKGCASNDKKAQEIRERAGLDTWWTAQKFRLSGEYHVYYSSGRIMIKCNYDDGKLDGEYVFYYESGQIKEKCNYKDGRLEGCDLEEV